jgi:hypothetical protein
MANETRAKILFKFLVGLGFELRALRLQLLYHLSNTSSYLSFLWLFFFGDRVSGTISLSWPQTLILLISTSQVARITGMSHQCLTKSQNS